MAQGCSNHPWNPNPNCMACNVKDIGRNHAAANDYQAHMSEQMLADQAYYAEMEAAARARRDAGEAAAQFSMWVQTPNGQHWERWTDDAQVWFDQASAPDIAVLKAWQQAATPGWDYAEAEKAYESETSFGVTLLKTSLGLLVGGFIVGMLGLNTLGWIGIALAPLTALFGAYRLLNRGAKPPKQAARRVRQSGFLDTYGTDPYVDPWPLPSWRAGLTRADNEAQLRTVQNNIDLPDWVFPAPNDLPDLPPLVARDRDEFPPAVADELRRIHTA